VGEKKSLDMNSKIYRLKITGRLVVNIVQTKQDFYYLPVLWDKKICSQTLFLKVFFADEDCIKFFFCSALSVTVGL